MISTITTIIIAVSTLIGSGSSNTSATAQPSPTHIISGDEVGM
jgi:hypothetical protein